MMAASDRGASRESAPTGCEGEAMAREDADRNLLFGVLALHNDLISREQLVAAVGAWAPTKARPLAEILVEQGALSAARRTLMEPLVEEHLRAHGGDPARSLASNSTFGPVREDLEALADPDVRASLAAYASTRPTDDSYATRPPEADPGGGSAPVTGDRDWSPRFRILRPHARGGLGEVFVAEDRELRRKVALKEIQARHADRPDSRARFLVEAEVTGALEHPGIVPVYGLGTYPDGRPFYAMRFISGDSLTAAIRRFHEDRAADRDPGERTRALQALLRRFLEVCDAMAYAHSKGVLHRDLKPDNIMLGKYGETLVVDWGLAKAGGQVDEAAGEEAVMPSSGSGLGTRGTLGTPQFMPPEQAAGELDRMGPASDVYSLGATLYMLLTGRPAFEDRDPAVVLQKVIRGDFLPPRQVNPAVPRALEAVCLKAMARQPEGRYATPRALAEDIEKWLADEPVSAWREPWTTRARRWATRHRTAVAATAAAALVALLAVSAYAAQRLATARGRADALATAEVRALPPIIEQLGADRRLIRGRLGRASRGDGSGTDDRRRPPAAMALLPDDPRQADFLAARLLSPEASPEEVLVIRDALNANNLAGKAVAPARKALAAVAGGLTDSRLRAAGALAGLAPADPALVAAAGPVAAKLARENPLLIGAWREVFQPIAPLLTEPLRRIYARPDEPEDQRALAFTLLYEFATRPGNAGEAEDLAALVGTAEPDQFRRLLGRLGSAAARDRAIAILTPRIAEPARSDVALARRQGRWAMALLRLGRGDAAWPLFRHRDDPSLRTELIHEPARFGLDPAAIAARLRVEPDASARSALVLCLGEFDLQAIPASDRKDLTSWLLVRYTADPDPGMHGAIDWLLRRRWSRSADLGRADATLAREAPPKGPGWYVTGQVPFARPGAARSADRGWYVNGQGQTYAIVAGPVEFAMGTPEGDPGQREELVHHARIGRWFAIAAREVTVAQYARFLDDNPGLLRLDKNESLRPFIPSPDCPIVGLDWYDCARYCNWLSKQEGIPEDQWCYPRDIPAEIEPGYSMRLPADYLSRTGYRLPTEAEWEYACRAGAASPWPMGRSGGWLPRYAWAAENSGQSSHPAGQLKPNDLGLFDVLGNAFEWLHDRYYKYEPAPANNSRADAEMDVTVFGGAARVLRGGSFAMTSALLRSAARGGVMPELRDSSFGIRPARTYP
jgi:formylglycine-generating enzyme required for sulfatase activity/tRNA A-37 threonylcarbamoyl transferase component Bud32